jgi:FMN-dependent NADH-azoreductase
LGSGMINFGPSSQLKAWFDHITWPGVTFGYSAAGRPQGLLTGKKVYLVTAAGGVFSEGDWAPFDFQTGYLRHLLGFIGLTDIEIIRVEGTEPPRDCRRPQLLRGWGHGYEEEDIEQIFT